MKLCIIIITVFNVPAAAVVSYCFYKNQDNANMMRNQSCVSGRLHLNENLISTDYNSSEKAAAIEPGRTDTGRSQVEMCVVFRYIVQQNLSSVVSSRSSRTDFTCDFRNWCQGKTTGFYPNETVEGHRGDLYCCDNNNCNLASKVPQLPPPQICYKNLHHWGHHFFTTGNGPYGTFTMCKDPDSWCIRSRPLNSSRWMTMYDCDNEHLCQYFNMTSGSSLVCRNVTQTYGKEELCCCSGHNCFPGPTRSTASIFGNPLAEEQRIRGDNGMSAATIGCIVAFSMLGLVGGAVMIGLMYQRQNLPHASNLTLTYSRIEDDDISDSIQML
ncbi:uncharacterized protein LOC143297843 [Babylonia areolata]|uniref:uncharacterized protein LOC143297843 n=1 Tax=Babylonia areolata TaxID=304850 RepID=UPI003FCF14CC